MFGSAAPITPPQRHANLAAYLSSPEKPENDTIADIDRSLRKYRSAIAAFLQRPACPCEPFGISPESFSPEMVEHVRSLEIPALEGVPSLLLHGIGTSRYRPLEESTLKSLFNGSPT